MKFTIPTSLLKSCILLIALPLLCAQTRGAALPDISWRDLVRSAQAVPQPDLTADSIRQARLAEERQAVSDIISSIETAPADTGAVSLTNVPWVFQGYHSRASFDNDTVFPKPEIVTKIWIELSDTSTVTAKRLPDDPVPDWLRKALKDRSFREEMRYDMMVANPHLIDYAYWDLPTPPVLPEEDYSFSAYLRKLNLPGINVEEAVITEQEINPINWLHTFNVAIQFSQAYLSPNWYQGGNSYLAFLGNLLWNVALNQVYHPNWLFTSDFNYKLAVNSTSDDSYHKYSVSTDLLQYNLKAGYKASQHWFYTFILQFKTPLVHSYATNSPVRTAAFLSPGELNLGLGMTYSYQNAPKTLQLSATLSPLSYNMTSCIDSLVDPTQFGINAGGKIKNEFGSNIEVNFSWQFLDNISYQTKVFLFSDYRQFQTDWQNTLNFQFNRFFSTQLFFHLRYDTSTPEGIDSRWKKLMLKEILSVGLSYSFSTR